MKTIAVMNVNDAYWRGMSYLRDYGEREESRNGPVLVAPQPVATVYRRPVERVLFDPRRDANPFFHVMECVWMLAGRRNARWLDTYVRDFSARYAESDGQMHAAYGYRWRSHFESLAPNGEKTGIEIDQLVEIGRMLWEDKTTRRAVLAMWDPTVDLGADKRDIPCNTHAYFRVRGDVVDMTVCCRSNDMIWGAYGANSVHMSVMGEVVAGLAGRRLGTYTQISNNFHAYVSEMDRITSRAVTAAPVLFYPMKTVEVVAGETPMWRQRWAARLLEQCQAIVDASFSEEGMLVASEPITVPWLRSVVLPMMHAHWYWRQGNREMALKAAGLIDAEDWRSAAIAWMRRRIK